MNYELRRSYSKIIIAIIHYDLQLHWHLLHTVYTYNSIIIIIDIIRVYLCIYYDGVAKTTIPILTLLLVSKVRSRSAGDIVRRYDKCRKRDLWARYALSKSVLK